MDGVHLGPGPAKWMMPVSVRTSGLAVGGEEWQRAQLHPLRRIERRGGIYPSRRANADSAPVRRRVLLRRNANLPRGVRNLRSVGWLQCSWRRRTGTGPIDNWPGSAWTTTRISGRGTCPTIWVLPIWKVLWGERVKVSRYGGHRRHHPGARFRMACWAWSGEVLAIARLPDKWVFQPSVLLKLTPIR